MLQSTLQRYLTNFSNYADHRTDAENNSIDVLCFNVSGGPYALGATTLTINNSSGNKLYISGLNLQSRSPTRTTPLISLGGSKIYLNSFIVVGQAIGIIDQPCLKIDQASDIQIIDSEFSNCSEGVRVENSTDIYIGSRMDEAHDPDRVNKIHDNGIGIHIAGNSQKVFARHNSFWGNNDTGSTDSGLGLSMDQDVNQNISLPFPLLDENESFVRYVSDESVGENCSELTAAEVWFQTESAGMIEMMLTESDQPTWNQGKTYLQEFGVQAGENHISIGMCREWVGKFITFLFHNPQIGSSIFSDVAYQLNDRRGVISAIEMTPPTAASPNAGGDVGASDGTGEASEPESAQEGPYIEESSPRASRLDSAGDSAGSTTTDSATGEASPAGTGAVGTVAVTAGGCGGGGTIVPASTGNLFLGIWPLLLPAALITLRRRSIR